MYGEYHKCLTQDLPWIQQNSPRETTTYAESLIRLFKPLCQTYTTGIICLLILILYIICPQMKQNKIILRYMPHMCHRTVAIFVHQFPTEKFNDRHLRRTLQVSKQIFSIKQNMC